MDVTPAESFWKRRAVQNAGLILAAVIAVYGLVYLDVVSRAKEAYMQGEKFMDWNAHPEKKAAALGELFQKEKEELDSLLAKKKISEDDYKQRLDSAQFDREFNLSESSLKYAYQWYKDTYELFSPPESKWVVLARQKAPQALAAWKEELTKQNVPFEDYMFE